MSRSGRTGPVAWDVHGGGPGVPLLLLHGVTDSGRCWDPWLAEWSADRPVLTVDLRGHGRSELPDEPFTIGAVTRDVVGVLRELATGPVVAFGHSLGGLVAQELALTSPDLVVAVVLEDPAWRRDRLVDERGVPDWLPPALASYVGETVDGLVARSRAENARWADDEHAPWAASKLEAAPALVDVPHAWSERNWVEVLADVDVPVTLLTGDPALGAIVDEAQVLRARELLGDLLTHVPTDAGHSVRREARDTVRHAVARALAEADRR